jgi:hypothetical protein
VDPIGDFAQQDGLVVEEGALCVQNAIDAVRHQRIQQEVLDLVGVDAAVAVNAGDGVDPGGLPGAGRTRGDDGHRSPANHAALRRDVLAPDCIADRRGQEAVEVEEDWWVLQVPSGAEKLRELEVHCIAQGAVMQA